MGKTVKITVPSDMTLEQFTQEFNITDSSYFDNLMIYSGSMMYEGQSFEIPVDHFGAEALPETSPELIPESESPTEEIAPFLYAIEDISEYVDQEIPKFSFGGFRVGYSMSEFVGMSPVHFSQSNNDLPVIMSPVGTTSVETSLPTTLYDVIQANSGIVGDYSNQLSESVQEWLNGADISSWNMEQLVQLQVDLLPILNDPRFNGAFGGTSLGVEAGNDLYFYRNFLNMVAPAVNDESLPFDPNQATREMYEAYFNTNRANVGTYATVADPNNPLMYELADAHRTALLEKIYVMMTYNDGFSNGIAPTFEQFQQSFIGVDGIPVPMEELTQLGMELAYHTFQKQAMEDLSLEGAESLLGPLPENIVPNLSNILTDYRYPMGQFDEYPNMTDRELFNHLYHSGLIDQANLRQSLIDQGIDPLWLMGNDASIAVTAAGEAVEMSTAYLGATALDESRQYMSAGCAEERRRLLGILADEIAKMPTEAVYDIEVGQVRQKFEMYHASETDKLNNLTSGVLTYEVERDEQMQVQENLEQIPIGVQLAVGAFSDVADVGFILREWYITGELPAFDSLITLLPILNYGVRQVIGRGFNLMDMSVFFRDADEINDIAPIESIMQRLQTGTYNTDTAQAFINTSHLEIDPIISIPRPNSQPYYVIHVVDKPSSAVSMIRHLYYDVLKLTGDLKPNEMIAKIPEYERQLLNAGCNVFCAIELARRLKNGPSLSGEQWLSAMSRFDQEIFSFLPTGINQVTLAKYLKSIGGEVDNATITRENFWEYLSGNENQVVHVQHRYPVQRADGTLDEASHGTIALGTTMFDFGRIKTSDGEVRMPNSTDKPYPLVGLEEAYIIYDSSLGNMIFVPRDEYEKFIVLSPNGFVANAIVEVPNLRSQLAEQLELGE